jgi:hypothetical protein
MKVKELVALLQQFPQDLPVAYQRYSEYVLLEAKEITTQPMCHPRPDGWIHEARPDMPSRKYLVLPGN